MLWYTSCLNGLCPSLLSSTLHYLSKEMELNAFHGHLLMICFAVQIDVENPCVIMSQDKSREFLHSGNDKDKFKVISATVCIYKEVH